MKKRTVYEENNCSTILKSSFVREYIKCLEVEDDPFTFGSAIWLKIVPF